MQNWIEMFRKEIQGRGIRAEEGLGTELFQFISSLTPIVNIDILLLNEKGQVLMSWRDDQYCGKGWHIPGGCVRLLETLDRRIHLTAINELGVDVDYESAPLLISENIADKHMLEQSNMERSHFLSLLYRCYVRDFTKIRDIDGERIPGHFNWFSEIPDDFLEVQFFYKSYLNRILKEGNIC